MFDVQLDILKCIFFGLWIEELSDVKLVLFCRSSVKSLCIDVYMACLCDNNWQWFLRFPLGGFVWFSKGILLIWAVRVWSGSDLELGMTGWFSFTTTNWQVLGSQLKPEPTGYLIQVNLNQSVKNCFHLKWWFSMVYSLYSNVLHMVCSVYYCLLYYSLSTYLVKLQWPHTTSP